MAPEALLCEESEVTSWERNAWEPGDGWDSKFSSVPWPYGSDKHISRQRRDGAPLLPPLLPSSDSMPHLPPCTPTQAHGQ